jgi:hypothetical protein
MAETSDRPGFAAGPMPTTEVEAQEYQPVSGWAIASVLVAAAYVVIIVLGGGIALWTWSPYLLPMWTLLLPLAGLALAWAAQLHIRKSEGTRAGARLARASWWTCLLLGVIYVSFYASTFMAVRQQADKHVRDWFELLKAGKVNEAFLKTKPPEERQTVSPHDENMLRARFDQGAMGGRGALSAFRFHEIVQLVQTGGAESQLEGLGVQDWQFTEGRYRVTRMYRITTPDGEVDVSITAIGAESKSRAYEGRQWHVFWDSSTLERAKLTERGERISIVRYQGLKFLERWREKLAAGTPKSLEEAYLDTQPVAEPEREAKRAAFRAGKIELRGFIDREHLRADDEALRGALMTAIDGLFRPRAEDQIAFSHMTVSISGRRGWEKTADDRLRFTYSGELLFVQKVPKLRCEVSLVVESEPGAIASGQSASWRILRMELLQVSDPLKPGSMKVSD